MKRTRMLALLVGIAMFSFLWQGYTLALLFTETEPVTNAFEEADCTVTVIEEFDGVVKQNVTLKTGGDTAQYLRLQIIPTLQDEQGNTLAVPITISDFTIEGFDTTAWVHTGEYYYYKLPVQPNSEIPVFDSACVKSEFVAGQIPTLIITAQGIQTNAAEKIWGVTLVDGVVTGGQSR